MKKLCCLLAIFLSCISSGSAYAGQSQAPSSASNPQQAQPAASAPSAAPQQTSFQRILANPDPDEIDIFLFYNHPAIRDRVQFSLTYDPWSKNEQPEFVK